MSMESPPRPLHHLALIYLALAHGTDRDLDEAEVALMADRLRVYQDGGLAQGTVVEAITEALKRHQEEETTHLDEAIEAVGAAYAEPILRRILGDMTRMATVDGKVLHAEAQFLGRLAHAWAVPAETEEELWSLLGPITETEWTPLHDLMFIYLSLAHDTDTQLSQKEVDAILDKIHGWIPDARPMQVKHLFSQALDAYVEAGESPERFKNAVASVKQAIPIHQRSVLLDDLRRIAYADGTLLPEEQEMIRELARVWEIGGKRE